MLNQLSYGTCSVEVEVVAIAGPGWCSLPNVQVELKREVKVCSRGCGQRCAGLEDQIHYIPHG